LEEGKSLLAMRVRCDEEMAVDQIGRDAIKIQNLGGTVKLVERY
jgi:hypothetical protein